MYFFIPLMSLFWLILSFPSLTFAHSKLDLSHIISLPTLINESSIQGNVSFAALAQDALSNNLSESQPNPIAKEYPKQTTATTNASYFIVPITFAQARAIVPARYAILTEQIDNIWEDAINGTYPLVIDAQIEHDIITGGFNFPDFKEIQLRFPFVDLLSNGHSPFTYIPAAFVANMFISDAALREYGIDVIVSNFSSPHDPYAFLDGSCGPRFVTATPINRSIAAEEAFVAVFSDAGKLSKKELQFYKELINQPYFASPSPLLPLSCGLQYHFYNTSVTKDQFAPVRIVANVSLVGEVVPQFPDGFGVADAKGARFDVPFLEVNYLNCSDLAGITDPA